MCLAVVDGHADHVFDDGVAQEAFANLLGCCDVGVGDRAVKVKFDALANADGCDFAVALAVQGVGHRLAGWV